jgi:hypothetical protein
MSQVSSTTNPAYDGDEFDALVAKAQKHFADNAVAYGNIAFRTTADGGKLYQVYLDAFDDAEQRQIHTCHCCRRFFEKYGDLAFVDADGHLVPAVWPEAEGLYAKPMQAVRNVLNLGKVTGVFLDKHDVWQSDNASAPEWTHFRVVAAPAISPFRDRTKTAGQAMASKRENYKDLMFALQEFPPAAVDTAIEVLKSEALYRSEKIIGGAEFLKRLHDLRATPGIKASNLMWVEIAKAPEGFCHPRAGVIGSLLEDIIAGKTFDQVKRAFDAKMHPARYQRPTALPSAGTVKQAEEIVAKMGIAPSLKRRQARKDEVLTFWTPKPIGQAKPEGDSVFGHLKTKQSGPEIAQMDLPVQTVTWSKFERTVLPNARRIQFRVSSQRSPFVGITAPSDMDAPAILQWDSEEKRNPYAWYLYVNGSMPSQWSLSGGKLVDVWGIGNQPSQWGDDGRKFAHQGESVIFYLDGARDQQSATLCLFPEILKSELHSVRSVIEAHSNSGRLEEVEVPACGIRLQVGQGFGYRFVVTTATGTAEYLIDRFD